MKTTKEVSDLFSDYLSQKALSGNEPVTLYEPIEYVLAVRRPRIRPILCIHSFQLFNNTIETILPVAASIELLHQFTLVHDDIIDQAPVRAGKPTLHNQYSVVRALLSSDTILILAFKELIRKDITNSNEIQNTFIQAAEDIHRGQQLDIDFEINHNISEKDYLMMIELKTSSLVGASMKMGALAGGADIGAAELMYDIGVRLGITLQIKDDYLDAYSNQSDRKTGLDIVYGKTTYMKVKFLSLCSEKDKIKFLTIYLDRGLNHDQKIKKILNFYKKYGIEKLTSDLIEGYRMKVLEIFESIDVPSYKKVLIDEIIKSLTHNDGNGLGKIFSDSSAEDNRIVSTNKTANDIIRLYEKHFFSKEGLLQNFHNHATFLKEVFQFPGIDFNNSDSLLSKLNLMNIAPIKVFISYSHKDELFKDRLDIALHAMKRNQLIEVWEDRLILAGQSWQKEIFDNLGASNVVILLISDYYIVSDFCYTKEFKSVLKDHVEGSKIIIPIIIRPCSWQDLEFGEIQALPKDGKPINTWDNEDVAWQEVVKAVKKSIEYFKK